MAEGALPAGDFSVWLTEVQEAIRGARGSDVPCAGCTACCTSSQFVHIAPEETGTLSRIPAGLLFPAPGRPPGHVVLGYDERGHCPMLVDDRCSIYQHRPQTCRTYDCRVFPAAGLSLRDETKVLIGRRAQRWRFGYPAEADETAHRAIRAAAAFLDEHPDVVAGGAGAMNATQQAVLAIEIHQVFLRPDEETGQPVLIDPDPDAVGVAVRNRGSTLDL